MGFDRPAVPCGSQGPISEQCLSALSLWLRYFLSKIEYPLGFSPKDLLVVSAGNSSGLCIPPTFVGRRRWDG